jgi:hypothetical protein
MSLILVFIIYMIFYAITLCFITFICPFVGPLIWTNKSYLILSYLIDIEHMLTRCSALHYIRKDQFTRFKELVISCIGTEAWSQTFNSMQSLVKLILDCTTFGYLFDSDTKLKNIIADVQAYICSHVKIYNNIDRSIWCEVTLVCLCLNCEINGGGAAVTVKILSHTIEVYIGLVHKVLFLDFKGWTSQRPINCIYRILNTTALVFTFYPKFLIIRYCGCR